MTPFTFTPPVVGQPHATQDPQVTTALTQLLSWGNTLALSAIQSGTHLINWGTSPVIINTGATTGFPDTIPHGLGVTPAFCTGFPMFNASGPGIIAAYQWKPMDSTNIYLQTSCYPASPGPVVFELCWLALV